MLKRQQRGELLLRDSPPVFGKPWYWQRSSSTMESTRSLAQVIMEMRDEIKKLEAENRELRGDCGQRSFGAVSGEGSPVSSAAEQRAGMEENPYVNLRRNASAPVLEGQYTGEEKGLLLHRWLLLNESKNVILAFDPSSCPPHPTVGFFMSHNTVKTHQ